MGKTLSPKPPKSLGPDGRELWRHLQGGYAIVDPGGLALLRTASEMRDLEKQAMQEARRDGLVTVDKYGQRRSHPLLTVARDARSQMLSALRLLHLDVETTNSHAGRPGGS